MTDSKEREDFKLFVLSKYPGASLAPRVNNCGITCEDSYAHPKIDFAWDARLARAKAVDGGDQPGPKHDLDSTISPLNQQVSPGRGAVLGESEDIEALRKDADRYRWLRLHFKFANDSMREIWFDGDVILDEPIELDESIDAAMAAGGE